MKSNDVIIKNSNIDKKGVFANRDFKKGEIVIIWDTSEIIDKEKADKLHTEEKDYLSFYEGRYIVMKSPAKYVNHSCSPNTYSENLKDIALFDIKKGDEITTDYSNEFDSDTIMKCNCKSKNCKKTIKC